MAKKVKLQGGFTIIEVLIYVLLVGIVGGAIAMTIIQIYRFQIIVQDRAQLNEDLRIMLKSVRDDMYLGDAVTVEPSGDLLITSSFSSPAEVRYLLSSGQVFRQENSNPPVAITHDSTFVQTLVFEDISTPSTAGVVQVELEMGNFENSPLKPPVNISLVTTITLKYI